MKLYNTLTRKKQILTPLSGKNVGLYTCGPTVYNFAHIGNLRAYLFEDILKRVLIYNGYKVKHVMNITDVGHLTSDADSGEDKMQKALVREGLEPSVKSLLKLADKYTKSFKSDLRDLNIIEPDVWCKATEHVDEMILMIKKLVRNGYSYETGLALYFEVTKFKDYTRLSRQKLEEKSVAARDEVEVDPKKKHPADFALWFKLAGKNKNHIMHWASPWGEGFPGWHIECSAMSTKYLGERFDIHCGGIDHIAVHHTNEIAQNDGAYGHPVVNFWLHNEFLVADKGVKMAKSGENFLTVEVLKKRGYIPLSYRYLTLNTHYRKQLQFSWEALDGAENGLVRLYDAVRNFQVDDTDKAVDKIVNKVNKVNRVNKIFKKRFTDAISDDLDMPKALAIAWEVVKSNLSDDVKRATLLEFDKVLGLGLSGVKKIRIPEKIKKLARERDEARKNKDFKRADVLRKKIEKEGFEVRDGANGSEVVQK